jgi:hypothetical protein
MGKQGSEPPECEEALRQRRGFGGTEAHDRLCLRSVIKEQGDAFSFVVGCRFIGFVLYITRQEVSHNPFRGIATHVSLNV